MGRRNNKMKIFLSVFFVFAAMAVFVIGNQPLGVKRIEASFIYSNKSGFEIEPDKLTFGALQQNQSASRDVSIENDYDFPVMVKIKTSGEIKDNLIVSKNNFELSPKESVVLTFAANPLDDFVEYRRYNGEVMIITERV